MGDIVPHSVLPYRRGRGVCDVTYRLNRVYPVYVPWGSGGVGLEAVSIGPKGRIARAEDGTIAHGIWVGAMDSA